MTEITADALLFDLDGTLVDSDAPVDRSWRRWAAGVGVDPEQLLPRVHGRLAREVVQELFPDRDPERSHRDAERMQLWQIADTDGVVPIPGARELLATLDGTAWAIVTSGPRALAEARLGAAGLPRPPVLITAEEVAVGKPDPEGYLKGAAALGARPELCVAFEDADAGVGAALAAGMIVVGVGTRISTSGCALRVATFEPVQVTHRAGGVTVCVV